jgi:hypothetical protein
VRTDQQAIGVAGSRRSDDFIFGSGLCCNKAHASIGKKLFFQREVGSIEIGKQEDRHGEMKES